MLALEFKGYLDGVGEFGIVDSEVQPYFFTFKVECANCHEVHAKPVAFSMHELKPLPTGRGEANFIMKCRHCGKEGNVTVDSPKLGVYTADSVKPARIATFDCRGLSLVEFIPDGEFWATGAESPTKFTLELEDDEWYDYDEKAGQEVSITNAQWTIAKTK